jgi:energy-coupling factor transporter ATP-binding protein EcfA2
LQQGWVSILARYLNFKTFGEKNTAIGKNMTGNNVRKKLGANRPVVLSKEDAFNTLPKAEMILKFIESNPADLLENRLLVLYGEWGSGKTTILKHLEKKLKNDFVTIFFEAWRHEKDGNLPLSLLSVICEDKKENKTIKSLDTVYYLMKTFAKSTKFNLFGITIDNKELLNGVENIKKAELIHGESMYIENKQFQEDFKKIEQEIFKNNTRNKLIVFIDDLDRCEPENVLDLLAAIKLFFTYGKKIIYFCALDKEAISQAVEIRYGKSINAEEYIEKIFDVSFSMPEHLASDKLLKQYFDKDNYTKENETYEKALEKISNFFNSIGFTNPRHLKKVLNKYLIIEYFKINKIENHNLIPDIILKEGGSTLNIIFVLYFIILYEFYFPKFSEIERYDDKISNHCYWYYQYVKSRPSRTSSSYTMGQAQKDIDGNLRLDNIENLTFDNLSDLMKSKKSNLFFKFLNIFTPKTNKEVSLLETSTSGYQGYLNQFST